MDDAEFAVLARATERTVGGWRRGENLPRLLVFDEIVARLKEMKDAWAVEDARGAGADHEKAAGKAGTENAFGDTAY